MHGTLADKVQFNYLILIRSQPHLVNVVAVAPYGFVRAEMCLLADAGGGRRVVPLTINATGVFLLKGVRKVRDFARVPNMQRYEPSLRRY